MKQQMLEAEVKELKDRIEALTAERDALKKELGAIKEAYDDIEQYAYRHFAEVEALTAENARLRDALERVVDEFESGCCYYDLQMYGPAISSIDVARAALNHGKETK